MRLTNGDQPRPQEYSDHAIDTAMLIRQVFKLALRQTEGLMTSIARVMGAAISIPDFSCISKRTVELPAILLTKAMKPGSVVIVESTGLKVYGKDEWHQVKPRCPSAAHLAVLAHQPDAKVVIPPHETAVPSLSGETQRDQHIQSDCREGAYHLATRKRLQPTQSCRACDAKIQAHFRQHDESARF